MHPPLKILFDVAVALVLYFVPGILLLEWFHLPDLRGLNRLLASLSVSLVIVPSSLIAIGNLAHFQPGLPAWMAIVLVLAAGALILRRRRMRPHVEIALRHPDIVSPGALERIGVIAYIAVFAAVVNLPRLLMFFQGNQVMELGPWDETWHILQLVSVARTGIPPSHYFFPSLHLAYYYASWIYPAILGNFPLSPVSLMRAMSIHAYLQVFAFLGIVYLVFQFNLRSKWTRVAGIAFFTVMGGFDLFARMPGVDDVEFWQSNSGWLAGNATMQISQFSTLYIWVPQHLAGAMVVVLLIFLFKNLRARRGVKIACTAVLLGFCLATSPYVFVGLGIAMGLIAIWNLRALWEDRRAALLGIVVAAGIILLIAWGPIGIYVRHGGSLAVSDFRVTLIERFRGKSDIAYFADRSLALLGLPLVGGFMLAIDMGLLFLLYLVWWGRRLFSDGPVFRSPEDFVLGLQPWAALVVFFIVDTAGGATLSMRGMITSQILVAFGGLLVLDWATGLAWLRGYRRLALAYGFAVFLLAQSTSTLAELRTTSKKVLEIAAWTECGVVASAVRGFDSEYCLPKGPDRYVYWLNQNTPIDSMILEEGPFVPADPFKFGWLERSRSLEPRSSEQAGSWYNDQAFVIPEEWRQFRRQVTGMTDALEWIRASAQAAESRTTIFLVTRPGGQGAPAGSDPVYEDQYVTIYRLESQLRPR